MNFGLSCRFMRSLRLRFMLSRKFKLSRRRKLSLEFMLGLGLRFGLRPSSQQQRVVTMSHGKRHSASKTLVDKG